MIARATGAARAAVRGTGLVALTAGTFVVWLAGHVTTLPSDRLSWAWRCRCFGWWSRAVLRLLSVQVVRAGERPSPPFVLAANHLSYLDVVVLASELDAAFVAKSEVASWPVLGFLCRCMGTLFVDRQRRRDVPRVLAEIESHLEAGHGVVLFPEGTSTDGEGVGRFKSPLLQAATDGRIGASFAALAYSTPPGSPPARLAVCWWGDMLFLPHLLGLLALPGLQARLRFGEAPILSTDRKALATRLRSEVSRLVPLGEIS